MLQFIRIRFGPRRVAFLYWYLLALAWSKSIRRLLPIVEQLFDHPWVARADLKIRFWPGGETRLYGLWRSIKSIPKSDLMHWDAPIAISVFRKRRGKERQALCMSLYVRAGILYIAQLQGVVGTDVPVELHAWAKMFIEACKKFARQEGLREVRVPKASTLASFSYPYGRAAVLTKAREETIPRIRRNMELLYDRNALDLGLVPDGGWYKWQNAPPIANGCVIALQRAIPIAVSLALVAASTGILAYVHLTQPGLQPLIYFYLLPVILVATLYTVRTAITCAGAALLSADYFLLDPVYSLYAYDSENLIWFAALAALAIMTGGLLPLRKRC